MYLVKTGLLPNDFPKRQKVVKQNVDNQNIVFAYQSTLYVDISDFIELHITEKSDEYTTKQH